MTASFVRPRAFVLAAALILLPLPIATACDERGADSAPGTETLPADTLTLGSIEEVRAEIENAGYEIASLEEYLDAHPDWRPADSAAPDPRVVLEAARASQAAARQALAAADSGAAVDSLRRAAERIEHVKRLLGVAEELGVEFEPEAGADSAPSSD